MSYVSITDTINFSKQEVLRNQAAHGSLKHSYKKRRDGLPFLMTMLKACLLFFIKFLFFHHMIAL